MRVLVIGDCMLDRYWHGDVSRISPEAPVPVVAVDRVEDRPGGAANVAANIRALGAEVMLVSIVGDDPHGEALADLCGWMKWLVKDSILTTVKLRVVGRAQQLNRCDFERHPSRDALYSMMDWYKLTLKDCDRVVLSDYGKGALAHAEDIVAEALAMGREVYVAPKGHDWTKYQGATLVKPNINEIRDAIGPWANEAELERKVHDLRRELGIRAILVTRAAQGMSLFYERGSQHIAAVAREVFDVTGAGDTVLSALTLAMATGARIVDAAKIANYAAGIVVGVVGTATVLPAQLKQRITGKKGKDR